MQKYGDLDKVRRILGHENPETTLIYAMADVLRGAQGTPGRRGDRPASKGPQRRTGAPSAPEDV